MKDINLTPNIEAYLKAPNLISINTCCFVFLDMASCLRLAFVLLALAWDAQVSAQWDSPYFEKPPDGGEGNVVFTQDDASPQIVKVEFDEGVPDTSKVVLTVMTYAGTVFFLSCEQNC